MSYYIELPLAELEANYHTFLARHGNRFGTTEEITALLAEFQTACKQLKRRDKTTPEGRNLVCALTTTQDLLTIIGNFPDEITALEIVSDDYIGLFMHPTRSAAYLWVCQQLALRQQSAARTSVAA